MEEINVRVKRDIHAEMVKHTEKKGVKHSHFASEAIQEKIERERKTEKIEYNLNGTKVKWKNTT